MSERQAARLIDWLVSNEWLERESGGGRRITNRYRIKLETLTNCPIVRGDQAVDNSAETLTNCPETLTPVSENTDIAMSYKPLEPLYNRKVPEPILAQRAFLQSLREMPGVDPEVIAEAEKNLAELLTIHQPQRELIDENDQ